MSERIVDIIKSKNNVEERINDYLTRYIPNEEDLIAVCNHCPKLIKMMVSYQIDTDCDIILKCIEYHHKYNSMIVCYTEDLEVKLTMMNNMSETIMELIMSGYTTKKSSYLCHFGILIQSLSILKHQFNDLTPDEKTEVLKYAVYREFVAGIKFIINEGVEYNHKDQKLNPIIKSLLEPGRFTKSAA